jgi:hypothetical protein
MYSVQSLIDRVEMQLEALSCLSEPLRELSDPDSEAIRSQKQFVEEIKYYFGTNGVLRQSKLEARFGGPRGLEEARIKAKELGKLLRGAQFGEYLDPKPLDGRFLSPETAGSTRLRGKSMDGFRDSRPNLFFESRDSDPRYKVVKEQVSPDRGRVTDRYGW